MKKNAEYSNNENDSDNTIHEPIAFYGMDTVSMRKKIVERVMNMKECQLKEMLRLSNELEKENFALPHSQDELETTILRGTEDMEAGRVVSHENVLKYYLK